MEIAQTPFLEEPPVGLGPDDLRTVHCSLIEFQSVKKTVNMFAFSL